MKSHFFRLISIFTILCFFVLSVPVLSNTTLVKAQATSNLLLQYKFDETSGSTASDASGNGFNGTLSSGASWSADGKQNGCVSLNGTNGYVTIPNGVLNGVHNITISADVYINKSNTNTWLFGLGPDSGKYIFVNSRNSSGYAYGAVTTNGTLNSGYASEKGVQNTTYLPAGIWTNVTLVLSTDTHSERFYINGSLVQSNNDITEDPASLCDAGKTFSGYIGKSFYSSDSYLNAKVDNFSIYNTALTASEISENSLLLNYDFHETSGSTVNDISGNGFSGSLSSTGASFSSGALSLDGQNGYVSIPKGVLKGVHNVTISADVFMNSPITNSWIFGIGPDSGSYLFITSKDSSGRTYAGITTNGTVGNGYQSEQRAAYSSTIPTGSWVNLALVVSADTHIEQFYINGTLVSSMSGITSDPASLYSAASSFTGYIGKSLYSTDPCFNGKIDNFRIYGAALNVSDIQKLAHATNSNQLQNGSLWLDTNGDPIDAYGGCILKSGSTYYWYGNSGIYVNCYSSSDLVHWTFSHAILGPNSLDSSGANASDLSK